ncbi:MAG: hypothetical protein IPL55_10035 [Saprospiraceae bacterium]|nr:hypothetical protein [Saprospiraceae bacterium]
MADINREIKIAQLGDSLFVIVPQYSLRKKEKHTRLRNIDDLDIDKVKLPPHGSLGVKGLVKRCLITKGCTVELRSAEPEKDEIYLVFKSKTRTMEKAVSELNMGQMVLLGIVLEDLK